MISWEGIKAYLPFVVLVVALLLIFCYVVVWSDLDGHWQAAVGTFMFGALTGATEIGSRYRDEPMQTMFSPYGLIYIVVNGSLSLLALLLILHYKEAFPFIGDGSDKLKAAIVAGFGATLVMRSSIAVIKTADDKEVPVGPDIVIRVLLQIIDTYIDRLRAVRRQRILKQKFEQIRSLGNFEQAFPYLFSSLLCFQNLDDALKQDLSSTFRTYLDDKNAPEDVKRLALGFVFLTLVGEANFSAIVDRAAEIKSTGITPQPGLPAPAPGAPPGTT